MEFTLGRVRILTPEELEAELDAWLGSVTRGCKFLIPEAIAGISAVEVAKGVHGVDAVELVSEEVRLGQRECVVRLHARVDRDLALLEREVQRRIDDVFVWPDGVVLPWIGPTVERIGYLGPAGTFSDTAAQQLARLLGRPTVERLERPDFGTLVGALASGEVDVAVVPITNSSSGLVDLAAGVLAGTPAGSVLAGGVVDVPVRFDAYVAPGTTITAGSTVLSHPQGFRQCSSFIAAMHLVEEVCTSTVEACHEVLRRGAGVALAARGVGEELGLELHRASVGNLAGALTRFLVLGRPARSVPHPAATSPSAPCGSWSPAPTSRRPIGPPSTSCCAGPAVGPCSCRRCPTACRPARRNHQPRHHPVVAPYSDRGAVSTPLTSTPGGFPGRPHAVARRHEALRAMRIGPPVPTVVHDGGAVPEVRLPLRA